AKKSSSNRCWSRRRRAMAITLRRTSPARTVSHSVSVCRAPRAIYARNLIGPCRAMGRRDTLKSVVKEVSHERTHDRDDRTDDNDEIKPDGTQIRDQRPLARSGRCVGETPERRGTREPDCAGRVFSRRAPWLRAGSRAERLARSRARDRTPAQRRLTAAAPIEA